MMANGNLSKTKTKSPVNSGVPDGLENAAEESWCPLLALLKTFQAITAWIAQKRVPQKEVRISQLWGDNNGRLHLHP